MCSWELVLVPLKMSVVGTVGQGSLKTLFRSQVKIFRRKSPTDKVNCTESAQTTQLYPLWRKPDSTHACTWAPLHDSLVATEGKETWTGRQRDDP